MKVHAVVVVPPPITGMTVVTQAFLGRLGLREDIDLRRSLVSRPPSVSELGWRLRKYLGLSRPLASVRPGDWVYLVAESRFGLIATVIHVATVRLLGGHVVLHHHTSSYLYESKLLFRTAIAVAPKSTRHVVLSDRMKTILNQTYPEIPAALTFSVSNTLAVESQASLPNEHGHPLRVAFVGNNMVEKGLELAFKAVGLAIDEGIGVQLHVAGRPVSSADKLLVDRVSRAPYCTFHGQVEREKIADFYRSIDVLVLPSTYDREAQPLVVLEALSFGKPVYATGVGDLAVLLSPADFVVAGAEELSARLRECTDRGTYLERSKAAALLFSSLQAGDEIGVDILIAGMAAEARREVAAGPDGRKRA